MASESRARILDLSNHRSATAVATAIDDQLATESDTLQLANVQIANMNLGGQIVPAAVLTLAPIAEGALTISSVTDAGNPNQVTVSQEVILADATDGAVTVTLPDPTLIPGKGIRVMKTDGGGNAVTVATPNSETINGAGTDSLAAQFNDGYYLSDGTNYLQFTG